MQKLKYFSTFNRCNVNQDNNLIKLQYLPQTFAYLHTKSVGIKQIRNITNSSSTLKSYSHSIVNKKNCPPTGGSFFYILRFGN